ncbi:hypothetical protein TNCV_4945621 [Trichonephila clavipes]|nr:hypothetical protein TNCV_4945621 [Trichonephila clavipes]
MLTVVYGDDSLFCACMVQWHKRFSKGRDSVQDDERDVRSSLVIQDETLAKISDVIRDDRSLRARSVQELAYILVILDILLKGVF